MDQAIVKRDGGYILLTAKRRKAIKVPITTADQAVAVWERYRDGDSFDSIGASDCKKNCGNIYSNDGTLVAKVSYNGRIWNTQGELIQDFA